MLSWLLSINTLIVLYFTLKKNIIGPAWGTIGQLLWFAYIYENKDYGLLPGVIAYTLLNAWGWRKWAVDGHNTKEHNTENNK